MAGDNRRGALFRPLVPHQHSRVTYAELFFDLVFVFAVTQISHTLLGRFTPVGALETTLLFLAVWWVWVYTSWVTNWLNPELTPVRVLLFSLMLGGLVLSTSIPQASNPGDCGSARPMRRCRSAAPSFYWPPSRAPSRRPG
jgi:low temperature requirement protein LtrA